MKSSRRAGDRNGVSAIILAAGKGVRFTRSKYPKQFARVLGKPLFVHCIERYLGMREIDKVYLGIRAECEALFDRTLSEFGLTDKVIKVPGGPDRQKSFTRVLDRVSGDGLVVLQNGVSPCTSPSLIRKCIRAARQRGAATAYLAPFHTVFQIRQGRLGRTLERRDLGYTCDPQAYRVSVIKKAVKNAVRLGLRDRPTLDLVRRIGQSVTLVQSDPSNLKVTINADLEAARHVMLSEPGKEMKGK